MSVLRNCRKYHEKIQESVLALEYVKEKLLLDRIKEQVRLVRIQQSETADIEVQPTVARGVEVGNPVHTFLRRCGFAEKRSGANSTGSSKVRNV